MEWHYGPTRSDSNPGRMWHTGCGGEVWFVDGVAMCSCGATDDSPDPDRADVAA